MSVRTRNWYAARGTQAYPVDENATGIDDAGISLPHDIIVDCSLNWDPSYGQYAFVSSVTVTDKIVSIIISACETPTTASSFTPLAVVTTPQPVTAFTHYAIEALQPGVAGFIVFGDVSSTYAGRFSTPAQSLIRPACAYPAHSFTVPTVRKYGMNTGLRGLVQLIGGDDIEVVSDAVIINNVETQVIAFRLAASTTTRTPLRDFIGPCGSRPESENCIDVGIEKINELSPDENGNINIIFQDLVSGPYGSSCDSAAAGITIDQELGLADVCPDNDYGKFSGSARCSLNNYDESSESSSSGSASESSIGECALPFSIDWEYSSSSLADTGFVTKLGSFDEEDYFGNRVFQAQNTSTRNLAIKQDCYTSDLYGKEIAVDFNTPSAVLRNAMLVFNYRTVLSGGAHIEYFGVDVDAPSGRLSLLRFNGTTFVTDYAVPLTKGLATDHWYTLRVKVAAQSATVTCLYVEVTGVTNPSWPGVAFTFLTNKYHYGEQRFYGISALRSATRFDNFIVKDASEAGICTGTSGIPGPIGGATP
jgi:hypothetical protein